MFIEIRSSRCQSTVIPFDMLRTIEIQCDSGVYNLVFKLHDQAMQVAVDGEEYNRFSTCLADPTKRSVILSDISIRLEEEEEARQEAQAYACA